MVARALRSAMALSALFAPACVVVLSDPNAPIENGGVSGPPADCSKVQPLGKGGPGTGAAGPRLIGRFDTSNPPNATFDWSGTTITARFQGTAISAGFVTVKPVIFTAVVDNETPFKFRVLPGQTSYVVAQNLAAGAHEVTLVRNSEASYDSTTFTGFNLPGGGQLLPPTERPRRIEYIGDSITCGYGIEGANATCPFDVPLDPNDPTGPRIPISENAYLAYGSLAARDLSAEAVTICFSGKGVYQNYSDHGAKEGQAPEANAQDPDGLTLMPQYWERTLGQQRNGPPWDFTKEPEPQVVFINLGTNDFMRDNNADSVADGIDLNKFRTAYAAFLATVRQRRPNAHIFLALSPMLSDNFPMDNARSDFRNVLQGLVNDANGRGDAKVYFVELVEIGAKYGFGCDYHPNLEAHRVMADQVAGAIRTKTCW